VLVLQRSMSIGDLNAFMLYAVFVAGSAGGLAGTAAQVIAAVSGPPVGQLDCWEEWLHRPCNNCRGIGQLVE